MALVSPGVSITINDQSQYVNSNVGSVPLVVLATASNKVNASGTLATGTTAANAGKLLSFTSQRDLIAQMGTPTFQLSSAGTPVNGSEINEYGLMAAYSALGLSNQLFAIRADIDLDQLVGTSVRPIDPPANGTYWLNVAATQWGIYQWNLAAGAFTNVAPLNITDPAQVQYVTVNTTNNVPTPLNSVGQIGQYAIVCVDPDGTTPSALRLFYKAGANSVGVSGSTVTASGLNNQWVEVGSSDWQTANPTATGTVLNPVIPTSSTFTINGTTVTTSSSLTTVAALAASINSAAIPGVFASAYSGCLQLFLTSASGTPTPDGNALLLDGTNTPLALCGIKPGYINSPQFFYGPYTAQPSWMKTDAQPRPTGSVWWKTSITGNGLNPSFFQYNSATGTWVAKSAPPFPNFSSAINAFDPAGGGPGLTVGQLITSYYQADTTYNMLRFDVLSSNLPTHATGGTPQSTISGSFSINASQPGTIELSGSTITVSSVTPAGFVSAILGANIPYVTAQLNDNGTITIGHTLGGQINIDIISGTPLAQAGFGASSGSGWIYNSVTNQVTISNFSNITKNIYYQTTAPYIKPASGTIWYYSNPADIDIMINNNGWKGYQNVTSDQRGYNLSLTDPSGVIVTPTTAPISQSDGTPLAAGDLWLDSGDLVNYPSLYRYNGTTWVAIDTTDHTTSNGIIFADARWDTSGTTDPISGAFPSVTALLTSNYIDLDAPDWRLYPRGTMLFNTRRSGYNVKNYVQNYFNAVSFPPANPSNNPENLPTATPTITDAWVSDSGLNQNGVMYAGSAAQRALIVAAMKSAIDSNLDVLSPTYKFNLICAPNYPELIPNMLTLNDNRGDTAFVIGDTPMTLGPNTVDITNWVNNTTGVGLPSDASASSYLALYYPSGLTNDLSGNQIVVPASHAVLRTYLYNDQVSYPWFAPAGVNRGLVSNLNDIGYINADTGAFVHNSVSQGLRDALFNLSINPITQLPGAGLVVFGQLTRSLDTTAQNRVNVVRLENYLRSIFTSVSNGYLFEPNDAITRKSIATSIENALNNVLAHRGLYDFLVICDTSNNTPATIANNQLYVDVAIEPMKDVEFIYIPIAIYNPGTIKSLNTQSS